MKRRFRWSRYSTRTPITHLHRVRRIESLELRHCCTAEDFIVSVPLDAMFEVTEIAYQPDVQAGQVTSELWPIGLEDVMEQASPHEEISVSDFDQFLFESQTEHCANSEGLAAEIEFRIGLGAGCTGIAFPAGPNSDSGLNGLEDDKSNLPSNQNGRGATLAVGLPAPVFATTATVPNDLRPQLQPIEQLSIGRISIAIPASMGPTSVQSILALRMLDTNQSLAMDRASITQRTLDEALLAPRSYSSVWEGFSFIRPAESRSNAVELQQAAKRYSRVLQDTRPRIVEVPRPVLEKLTVPTMGEANAKAGLETESPHKQVGEIPIRPSLKVIKKSGADSGAELGLAAPTEPAGKWRGQLILGAVVSGLVAFPRPIRGRPLARIASARG